MTQEVIPLKTARIVTLQLTAALATVAACIGLHALVKSNQSKTALRSRVSPPTRLVIDTSSIQNSGIVATVGNILLASFAFISFCITFLPFLRRWANKTLRLQAGLIAFSAVWVFVCMIPFMKYFVNDHASISAFIGETRLPDSLVQSMQEKSGHSTRYKDMWYLRLLAIFPWLSIASAIITVPVLLKAASATASTTPATEESSSAKETIEHSEKAY
ncbi:hypothetical protein CC1G_07312 [Coprinopsis cinerea okayama7|uniref:Uncharacterized protein n=1 Tax=Coprinopsis cinerea (strain Okayama-7 / 130 / ATCC MYA-4618 / FGSC 9003) TaxID=240176 RepID=A8NNP8_COPC7|nr:hypothetical protein CC1G_07312 [Coprinopsis cinerea okayama7\|eukprot:XP_001835170.1 hypothetical protein CC1G_07312 [Coprinopsis cinerea okayama7\